MLDGRSPQRMAARSPRTIWKNERAGVFRRRRRAAWLGQALRVSSRRRRDGVTFVHRYYPTDSDLSHRRSRSLLAERQSRPDEFPLRMMDVSTGHGASRTTFSARCRSGRADPERPCVAIAICRSRASSHTGRISMAGTPHRARGRCAPACSSVGEHLAQLFPGLRFNFLLDRLTLRR